MNLGTIIALATLSVAVIGLIITIINLYYRIRELNIKLEEKTSPYLQILYTKQI